ncbi:MAG: ribonuclease PH [Polyangia bacterium]
MRPDGRALDALRPTTIEIDYLHAPLASALVRAGETWVLCTASVDEQQPPFLRAQKSESGWVTAEYNMLPGSTAQRTSRGANGRAKEIERLIGRSLRAAVDLMALGPRTLTIDCDVLQADGGTRTAAITGGWVALALGVHRLQRRGLIPAGRHPVQRQVAAISVGLVDGELRLDLPYLEDARAEVDMNIVMARPTVPGGESGAAGSFVEVQGTGEHGTFSRGQLDGLLTLAEAGVASLFRLQDAALSLVTASQA